MGGWQEHFVQPPPLLCPCRDPCFPVPTAGKPCPALSWCLVHSRDWNSLHWFLTIHSKTESQAGAQMLLPLSNLISFLSDFSMAICSLALLFFLTIKFCLDIRLFLLPSQMILFYLFMYFWQVWRQVLSYTVIFKWDHSALAGSVLPTPGLCVWWDSGMTRAERMYRGGDLLIPLLNDQKRFQMSLISALPLFLKYPLRAEGRSQLLFITIPLIFVKKYCCLLIVFHFSRS